MRGLFCSTLCLKLYDKNILTLWSEKYKVWHRDVSIGETGVQITDYSIIVTAELNEVNGHVGVSGGKSEEWHLTRTGTLGSLQVNEGEGIQAEEA